jgi:20S proteasome alpha/beta subunit
VTYKQQLFLMMDEKINIANCVKKVHHIYDNLVVGFAGDIKVGLKMIEKLKALE